MKHFIQSYWLNQTQTSASKAETSKFRDKALSCVSLRLSVVTVQCQVFRGWALYLEWDLIRGYRDQEVGKREYAVQTTNITCISQVDKVYKVVITMKTDKVPISMIMISNITCISWKPVFLENTMITKSQSLGLWTPIVLIQFEMVCWFYFFI